MSQLQNLTREQKEAVFAAGITTVDNWMLVEETDFYLKIEHVRTHTRRRVDKYVTKNNSPHRPQIQVEMNSRKQ